MNAIGGAKFIERWGGGNIFAFLTSRTAPVCLATIRPTCRPLGQAIPPPRAPAKSKPLASRGPLRSLPIGCPHIDPFPTPVLTQLLFQALQAGSRECMSG